MNPSKRIGPARAALQVFALAPALWVYSAGCLGDSDETGEETAASQPEESSTSGPPPCLVQEIRPLRPTVPENLPFFGFVTESTLRPEISLARDGVPVEIVTESIREGLYRVTVPGGLEESSTDRDGGDYLFTYTVDCSWQDERSHMFRVGPPADLPAALGTIEVSDLRAAVNGAEGDLFKTFLAVVSFHAAPALEPWKDVYQHTVLVDGGVVQALQGWRPEARLFVDCDGDGIGIPPGVHEVVHSASLPGDDAALTSPAVSVDFRCEDAQLVDIGTLMLLSPEEAARVERELAEQGGNADGGPGRPPETAAAAPGTGGDASGCQISSRGSATSWLLLLGWVFWRTTRSARPQA